MNNKLFECKNVEDVRKMLTLESIDSLDTQKSLKSILKKAKTREELLTYVYSLLEDINYHSENRALIKKLNIVDYDGVSEDIDYSLVGNISEKNGWTPDEELIDALLKKAGERITFSQLESTKKGKSVIKEKAPQMRSNTRQENAYDRKSKDVLKSLDAFIEFNYRESKLIKQVKNISKRFEQIAGLAKRDLKGIHD